MVLRMPLFRLIPRSSPIPHSSATKRTRPSDLWVLSWSATKTHVALGSKSIVLVMCATKSSSVLVGPMVGRIALPVTTSKFPIRQSVPCRLYSNSFRSMRPGRVIARAEFPTTCHGSARTCTLKVRTQDTPSSSTRRRVNVGVAGSAISSETLILGRGQPQPIQTPVTGVPVSPGSRSP